MNALLTVPKEDAPAEEHFMDSEAHAYHQPVLLRECVELLRPAPEKVFIDATLGGGGHSEALLLAGARVIGIDQDPEAIAFATCRLERFGSRFQALRSNFAEAGAQ